MTGECSCLQVPFASLVLERELGMDDIFGEVSLWRCTACGRPWLHYHYELEAFMGSGRWFLGPIWEEAAARLTAEAARATLEELPWYYSGGSYFDGAQGATSGPLAV